MFGKLRSLFGKKGVIVPDAAGLEEGQAKSVNIGDPLAGGLTVLLCRVDGVVYALDAECPHGEGGRLTKGPLFDGKHALCPLHNYRFDPCSGAAVGVACKPARRFKVVEANGQLEVFC
jgi:nitrite reductase/ring-hydroxylating ferredoxin subunit